MPCGDDTVEHVHAPRHALDPVHRYAHPHELPPLVGGVVVQTRPNDLRRKKLLGRAGGPVAEMQALAVWGLVCSIRLLTVVVCVLLATVVILLLPHDQMAYAVRFALLVGAAGCLRLDVDLLG